VPSLLLPWLYAVTTLVIFSLTFWNAARGDWGVAALMSAPTAGAFTLLVAPNSPTLIGAAAASLLVIPFGLLCGDLAAPGFINGSATLAAAGIAAVAGLLADGFQHDHPPEAAAVAGILAEDAENLDDLVGIFAAVEGHFPVAVTNITEWPEERVEATIATIDAHHRRSRCVALEPGRRGTLSCRKQGEIDRIATAAEISGQTAPKPRTRTLEDAAAGRWDVGAAAAADSS